MDQMDELFSGKWYLGWKAHLQTPGFAHRVESSHDLHKDHTSEVRVEKV